MKLVALRIARLYGAHFPLSLEPFAPGLNALHGPNASGKSSALRAFRALLWPQSAERRALGAVEIEAQLESADGHWRVRLEGSDIQARWTREGLEHSAPLLPPVEQARCLFVGLDELLLGDESSELEQRVAQALAGGFDLLALHSALTPQSKPGFKEFKARNAGRAALSQLTQQQQALARREEGLEALRAQVRAARQASAELAQVTAASKLHAARAELATAEARRAALPASARLVRPGDRELAQELALALSKAEQQLAEDRRAREQCAREQAQTSWPANAPATVELRAAQISANALSRDAQKVRELNQQRAGLAQQQLQAERLLEAAGLDQEGSDPEVLKELCRALSALERDREQLANLRAELETLPAAAGAATSDEAMQRALDALAAWLAREQEQRLAGSPAGALAGLQPLLPLAACVLLVAAGALLGLLLHPAGWALAALGAAFALLLLRRPEALGFDPLAAPRARFAASAQREPASWTSAAVEARQLELRAEQQQRERLRAAEARRAQLERELALALARLAAAEQRRAALAQSLGLEFSGAQPALEVLARELELARERRQQLDDLDGRLAQLHSDNAAARERLDALLARAGEPPIEDDLEAFERLQQATERARAQQQLLERLSHAQDSEARSAAACEERRRAQAEFSAARGLAAGDEAALEALLPAGADYAELTRQCASLGGSVRALEQPLAEAPALLSLSELQLDEQRERLEQLVAQEEPLRQQLQQLEQELQLARGATAVEEALARQAQAQAELDAAHASLLEQLADDFLVVELLEAHQASGESAVLRRAQELFASFTRQRWQLYVARDAQGLAHFQAQPSGDSAQRHALDALSSGTRTQLLLAARLAFALESEGREPLPLWLDEILATSDPERFEAIGEALASLVRDHGRQVVYLTSDAQDLAALRAAVGELPLADFDLAALRGLEAAQARRALLTSAAVPALPEPQGHSAEAYARLLGVPPLDPWGAPAAQDLYYLLHDDLRLLHALRSQFGMRSLGELESWAARAPEGLERAGLDQRRQARLALCAAAFEHFLRLWHQNRSRPLVRDDLAGVVRKTFLDVVWEIAQAQQRDARQTLAELRRSRPAYLREKTVEQLERQFEDEGLVSACQPLSPAELLRELHVALAAELRAGLLGSAELGAWCAFWLSQIAPAEPR